MHVRRIAMTGIVSLALGGVSVGQAQAADPPPPPPQMTITLVHAKLVARGTAVNVTLNVTCDNLNSEGDGYEPSTQDQAGRAGGMIQVQLAQASGKTLAQGNGFFNIFDPNQFCNGTAQTVTVTVQAFGSVPFKTGTASLQGGGLQCGDFIQNFSNNGPPGGSCDNQDPYDPNANTGDPGEFGNLGPMTIKVASR